MSMLIVANWKLYMSYREICAWANNYIEPLAQVLAQSTGEHKLAICPPAVALETLGLLISRTRIALGAQECSQHLRGAYTGEISPLSLQELGCSYCIIGHSEQRLYHHESDSAVAQKAALLCKLHISPIICIGEQVKRDNYTCTQEVLAQQLELILPIIKKAAPMPVYIAYEPVWAIGTGTPAPVAYVRTILSWLRLYIQAAHVQILYGGSVHPEYVRELGMIRELGGFLLGKVSVDFQALKNIVLS